MANDYFDSDSALRRFTLAKASDVNGLFGLVRVGFDRLPARDALTRDMLTYTVAGGTATTLTAALPTTLTALVEGARVTVKMAAAATGAATLNVDGLGPRGIKRSDQTDPGANEWLVDDIVTFVFAKNSWVIHTETGYTSRKATAAANSETAAASSAAAAEASKVASQTARTGSETAQTGAQAAQAGSEAARDAAVSAKTAAETARTGAQAAQAASESARNTSQSWAEGATAPGAAGTKSSKTHASEAAASASSAAGSASAASTDRTAVEAIYDNFDDRYLGAKASNPALDNDGNALLVGALYFNTTVNEMRVRTASAWLSTNYNSANVDINGGTIDGTTIGATTPSTGAFTSITGTAVQSNATDTTAGRLLKVGSFGLGGLLPLIGDISVTDNSIAPGHYTYITASGSTGGPTGVTVASLTHLRRSAGGGETQLLASESPSGEVYSRSRVAGAWSAWRRSVDDTDILGTVSQSGGVPTGAIIERGSNANGRFVRFADGTQICTNMINFGPANTSVGNIFSTSGEATWTFPAGFITSVDVSTNAAIRSGGSLWCNSRVFSNNDSRFRFYSAFSSTSSLDIELMAIGRWY